MARVGESHALEGAPVKLLRLFVLALALVATHNANACDRRDIYPPAVYVALADVIVKARVDQIGERRVTVTPVAVRKGALSEKKIEIVGLEVSPDTSTLR